MREFEFREKYGITPKGFAEKYLDNYKERNGEIVPKKCPFCKPTKRDNFWTFAINRESGAYNCKRQKCGAKGSFRELLVEFGEIDENSTVSANTKPHDVRRMTQDQENDYENPDISDTETDLSDEIIDWFNWREISEETLAEWDIREEPYNGGKFNHKIAFPYWSRDGDEVVLMKYRLPNRKKEDKQIWEAGGGKKVLWGLNKLDTGKPLIIAEGEIDALSISEAGFDNVTSVPFGAEKFSWLDSNWELIDKFDEIILWMDSDGPGRRTTEQLIKRLGKWRTKVVRYDEHKDANKALFVEGEEAVRSAVENAEQLSINGLHNLSDIEDWDPTDQDKILSSLDCVNNEMQGYFLPSVTIITGLSSSGKSTFVDQEAVHAVSQGYKTLIYSGELKPTLLRYWLERQMCTPRVIARKEDERTGATNHYVPREYKDKMRSWYHDDLFIYDTEYNTEGEDINYEDRIVTAEKLLDAFEYAVKRHGVEVFVVDNLMTVDFSLGLDSKWDEQTRFLAMMKNFANQYDVAVLLVAHPRKNEGRITIQDIAGRMNIVNYVDSILSVKRIDNKKDEDLPPNLQGKDSSITFLKDRLYGTQRQSKGLYFNEATKRFYETEKKLKTVYDWAGVDI